MPATILVLGSGGREHALICSLAKSKSVTKIYACPGNGGTSSIPKTESIDINYSKSFAELIAFAVDHKVGLCIPGPEQPLVDGISDALKEVGIPCFGPSKAASRMEGSKSFSKEFMKKHSIPTAKFEIFNDFSTASAFFSNHSPKDYVIKASGLAAGKGVILPETKQEAVDALESIMVENVFGDAGNQVVIEERLVGQEVSILAFSDGYTVIPFPAAQDHKRIFDGDQGPNTGGMGAYAPAPIYTNDMKSLVDRTILKPSINGMRRDGFPFVGILYVGVILTPTGPKVLEYNVRFGDPETQVLLPLLSDDCDLAEIMLACTGGRLDSVRVSFKPEVAATVVLASAGYPGSYTKGKPITIPNSVPSGVEIFHAGSTIDKNYTCITNGGRVLAVTGVSTTIESALKKAYEVVKKISFEGVQYRKDIGHRAMNLSTTNDKSTYSSAGVSIDNGNLLIEKIKPLVKATMRVGADAELGGFGGVFDLKACGYEDPILISGTDGVGTKCLIAQKIGKHDTIGIDLVAMSVNDVLVQGAEPLYFLDYFACSKLEVDVAKDVVAGIAQGCLQSRCALIGGETAEMPGLYAPGDYDLAGFVVGAVERKNILPRLDEIIPGDVIIGLSSSGIHSNGYSLVRHIIKNNGFDYDSPCPFPSSSATLGESLLTPTKIYVQQLSGVIKGGLVKSMAHITGGGFIENIPRALRKDLGVVLDAEKYPLPEVFKWLKRIGKISCDEMSRTFNCGIGMILIVSQQNVDQVMKLLKEASSSKEEVFQIGKIVDRSGNLSASVEPVFVLNMEKAWK